MGKISSKLRSIATNRGPGVSFWCPGCDEAHAISVKPLGGAGWEWDSNADAPTFSPSILVTGKRRLTEAEYQRVIAGEKIDVPDARCHSFVRAGRIEFLGDCTHALAGRTVPLPDWPSAPATTEST